MAALTARPFWLVGICRLEYQSSYFVTSVKPRWPTRRPPRAARRSTEQHVAVGVRPITPTAV